MQDRGPQAPGHTLVPVPVQACQEVNSNVMHLNHPETIALPWSVAKLSSTKLVPGAKMLGTPDVGHKSEGLHRGWQCYQTLVTARSDPLPQGGGAGRRGGSELPALGRLGG